MNITLRPAQAVGTPIEGGTDAALITLCGKYIHALEGLQRAEKALQDVVDESWAQLPPPDPLIVFDNTKYLEDLRYLHCWQPKDEHRAEAERLRAANIHIHTHEIKSCLKNCYKGGPPASVDANKARIARMRDRLKLAKARDRAHNDKLDALGVRCLQGHINANNANSQRWLALICATPAQSTAGARAKLRALNAAKDRAAFLECEAASTIEAAVLYLGYRQLLSSFLGDAARVLDRAPGERQAA